MPAATIGIAVERNAALPLGPRASVPVGRGGARAGGFPPHGHTTPAGVGHVERTRTWVNANQGVVGALGIAATIGSSALAYILR